MVNVKAKVDLKSSIIVWDMDYHCFRDYSSFYNTSAKI